MDWTAIIVALIGAVGAVGAEALRRSLRRIGGQVHDIEQSINNRSTPMSDRVDEAIAAGAAATLGIVGVDAKIDRIAERFEANHAEGMAAHADLGKRVEQIGDAERHARIRLDLHISETEYMLPMLRDLHGKWGEDPKEN